MCSLVTSRKRVSWKVIIFHLKFTDIVYVNKSSLLDIFQFNFCVCFFLVQYVSFVFDMMQFSDIVIYRHKLKPNSKKLEKNHTLCVSFGVYVFFGSMRVIKFQFFCAKKDLWLVTRYTNITTHTCKLTHTLIHFIANVTE